MPKIGISDLLSVDEWIGVDSAVSVARGTIHPMSQQSLEMGVTLKKTKIFKRYY